MISRKEVEHIVRLARIELSEAEKARFEKELSAILEFVAKLNELDTNEVEPLSGGTDITNAMRDDQHGTRYPEPASLIDAVPKKRDGYVEVKAVFERE